MNLSSVSVKLTFKKYNEQDIIFYKENYSLDEITSKLLSIRKIKGRRASVPNSFN